MAIPVAETPILTGADARRFEETIKRDLKNPVGLVDTPKLEKGLALVRKYAEERKKSAGR